MILMENEPRSVGFYYLLALIPVLWIYVAVMANRGDENAGSAAVFAIITWVAVALVVTLLF